MLVRARSRSVIVTACEWCMIIPCMKLMSAADGARAGAAAVSLVSLLLSCPGAPGCTMGALSCAVDGDWPDAMVALNMVALKMRTAAEVRRVQALIMLEIETKTDRQRGSAAVRRVSVSMVHLQKCCQAQRNENAKLVLY